MSTREDRIGAPAAEVADRAQGVGALLRTTLPLAAILVAVVTGLYVYSNATPRLGMSATAPTGALPSLRDSRPLVETEPAKEMPVAPAVSPQETTAAPVPAPLAEPVRLPSTLGDAATDREPEKTAPVETPPAVVVAKPEIVSAPETTPMPAPAIVAQPTIPPQKAAAPPPASPRTPEAGTAAGATLLQRGRVLLEQGNIAAARLFLERATAADNAEAALLLGATFDPKWLRTRGVVGMTGDPARAKKWYLEAERLGSREAASRLSGLETESK